MDSADRYGWDRYKEQGLAELINIRDSTLCRNKKKLRELLNSYINLYKEDADIKGQISGKNLFPDLYNKHSKSALDSAYLYTKKLRKLLYEYYTTEGKHSTYRIFFVSDERDYKLGIKKLEIDEYREKEKTESFIPTQLNLIKSNEVFEKTLNLISNFVVIPYAAVFKSPNLALRVTQKEKFRNNKIHVTKEGIKLFLLLIVLWFSIVSLTEHILKSLNILLFTKFNYEIDPKFLEIQLKRIEHLKTFPEFIFSALRFLFIIAVIPWFVYKIFKSNVYFLSLTFFQIYFFMSWLFVFAFFEWLNINSGLNIIVLLITSIAAPIWSFIMHFKGLCALYNLSWKKGILPFILTLVISLFLIKVKI